MEQIPIRDGDRSDNVVPLPSGWKEAEAEPDLDAPASPPEPSLGPLLEQTARIVAGFVSACAAAVAGAVREATPSDEVGEDGELPDDPGPPPEPSSIGLAAGAAAGLAIDVSEAAIRAVSAFADTAGPILSWLASPAFVRHRLDDVEARAHGFNERWIRERGPSQDAATEFARRLIPEITNAVLDQIDLTQVAIDHIEIDRIVESIDLNAIIERVDIEAIIERVDLVAIVDELFAEIDLPELIRASTGAVTSETVRSVRMQSAEADLLVSRLVDRLLLRRREGETDASQGDDA